MLDPELQKFLDINKETFQEFKDYVDRRDAETIARIDALQIQAERPGSPTKGGRGSVVDGIVKAITDGRDDFARYGQLAFNVAGSVSKALTSEVGAPVGGTILESARLGLPFQLRALLPSIPVGSGQVWSIEETAVTPNVTQQAAQGDAFSESTVTIGGSVLQAATFGTYCTISEQALSDIGQVRSYLERVLAFGMASKIENYLLTKLKTGATAVVVADYPASIENQIDELAAAASQLTDDGFYPSIAVVHPSKLFEFRTLKSDTAGNYLFSDPASGQPPNAFGLAVAPSTHQAATVFSIIDPNPTVVYDVGGTRIEVGRINDDFSKGLVRIRAVERLVLAKAVAGAVMTGTFTK